MRLMVQVNDFRRNEHGEQPASPIAEAALAVAAATAALLLGVIVFVGLRHWLVAREE